MKNIRELNLDSAIEIEVVARRMRETLIEVMGAEQGSSMYSLSLLVQRVKFHLDPQQCCGAVLVGLAHEVMIGHCIVRVENFENQTYGLFSTSYVVPEHRRSGWGEAFLLRGEAWMRAQNMEVGVTYTDRNNSKLIYLYQKHGYKVVAHYAEQQMIRLEKDLRIHSIS